MRRVTEIKLKFCMYVRTKSSKRRKTSYPIIISIYIYSGCVSHLVRNSCNTSIFEMYTLINIRPANQPKKSVTLFTSMHYNTRLGSFPKQKPRSKLCPYQIREKRSGIIIKTIHDSAGKINDRYVGIFVSTWLSSRYWRAGTRRRAASTVFNVRRPVQTQW